jgi:hypothetical protein
MDLFNHLINVYEYKFDLQHNLMVIWLDLSLTNLKNKFTVLIKPQRYLSGISPYIY